MLIQSVLFELLPDLYSLFFGGLHPNGPFNFISLASCRDNDIATGDDDCDDDDQT